MFTYLCRLKLTISHIQFPFPKYVNGPLLQQPVGQFVVSLTYEKSIKKAANDTNNSKTFTTTKKNTVKEENL